MCPNHFRSITQEHLDLPSSNSIHTSILGSKWTLLILGSRSPESNVPKPFQINNSRTPWRPSLLKLCPHIHSILVSRWTLLIFGSLGQRSRSLGSNIQKLFPIILNWLIQLYKTSVTKTTLGGIMFYNISRLFLYSWVDSEWSVLVRTWSVNLETKNFNDLQRFACISIPLVLVFSDFNDKKNDMNFWAPENLQFKNFIGTFVIRMEQDKNDVICKHTYFYCIIGYVKGAGWLVGDSGQTNNTFTHFCRSAVQRW